MFRTGAQLMLLTLLGGIFLLRESGREPLSAVDEHFTDFLTANARRSEKPAPVTLIGIDEASLKEHPIPWTPGDYALFFNAANSFHPDLVATDEILAWDADRMPPEAAQTFAQYAQILRENVRKSARTLLAAELSYPEDADKIPPLESMPGLRKVAGNVSRIPEFRIVDAQAEEELRLASTQGFNNLPTVGASNRSVPLLLRYCGQVVPSFVLQAAMLWEKVTLDEVEVELGSQIRLGSRAVIPIDTAGRMRVNLALPIGRCSFDDLVMAAEQKDAKNRAVAPADLFAGRALLLSRIDSKAVTVPIALGHSRPRGELFALAVGTIQNRTFVVPAPPWCNLAAIGFLTLASFWVPRLSRGQVALHGTVLILAVLVSALALIGTKLIALSIIVPVGLTLFLILARLVSPNSTSAPEVAPVKSEVIPPSGQASAEPAPQK